LQKAKFSKVLPWARDFNSGEYVEPRLITLTPGAEYALMLLPNNSVRDIYNQRSIFDDLNKAPIYSIPQLKSPRKC